LDEYFNGAARGVTPSHPGPGNTPSLAFPIRPKTSEMPLPKAA
jgi:hypothetical protein